MKTLSQDTQLYIMNTALLECCEHNNLETSEVRLFKSKTPNKWYIIHKTLKTADGKSKCYFSKQF